MWSIFIFAIGLLLLIVGSDKARSSGVVATLLSDEDAPSEPRANVEPSRGRYERPRIIAWIVGALCMVLLRRTLGVVVGPQEIMFALLGAGFQTVGKIWIISNTIGQIIIVFAALGPYLRN